MSENPKYVRVGDVMTPTPKIIDGLASVLDAIKVMRDSNVSSLVIDRRHDGDEYGLLVVHDIAEKVIGQNKAPERVSVYEIMSKPVLTVTTDMDIKYAVRLLSRFRLSRTLVTDNGNLVGLVTLRDMALRFVDFEEPRE
ncbi:MAG: CBS domain-containing protein [Alphaproteobacteria bacterium]|nr:CBS domain-containing protein [Alphaproteobacteria bacterium]